MEDLGEELAVARDAAQARDQLVLVRQVHLIDGRDRPHRLLFQRAGPPVPELRVVVRRVEDGGRVPPEDLAAEADCGRKAIRESLIRTMAGSAARLAVA